MATPQGRTTYKTAVKLETLLGSLMITINLTEFSVLMIIYDVQLPDVAKHFTCKCVLENL